MLVLKAEQKFGLQPHYSVRLVGGLKLLGRLRDWHPGERMSHPCQSEKYQPPRTHSDCPVCDRKRKGRMSLVEEMKALKEV